MSNKPPTFGKLTQQETEAILRILESRFTENMHRHAGVTWASVQGRLEAAPDKLWSLSEMERTGGEPDLVFVDKKSDELHFFDCAAESPKGRRSFCYDQAALNARKEHKPKNSALELAQTMGIQVLTESQYRQLQEFGEFDTKTSSWLQTPAEIRKLGGAIFGDRRYDTVFIYHNGVESYYASRGFRGVVTI